MLVDAALRAYAMPEGFGARFSAIARTAREDVRAAREQWLADSIFARSLELPHVARALRTMVADDSMWTFLNANPHTVMMPPGRERLGELAMPTLVVVGERDGPDFHTISRLLADGIAGAERVEIADAGHMSNMDAPDAFNDVLGAFLARIS